VAVDVIDLVGPRGSRRDLSQKISGTRYGTYEAQAPFERGDLSCHAETKTKDLSFMVTGS